MIMTMDLTTLEFKLQKMLNKLLSNNLLVANVAIGSYQVHVCIYDKSTGLVGRLLSRLEYDLTVLEPGLEEAAKRIHLDWLFS